MARTIGRKWRKEWLGDGQSLCDACDTMYRRSQLVRKPGGALLCFGPGTNNDAEGRDAYECDMANARSAGQRQPRVHPDPGRYQGGEQS